MKLYDVLRQEKEEGKKLERREEDDYVETPLDEPTVILTPKRLMIIGGIVLAVVAIYGAGLKLAHARVIINERRIPFTLTNASIELANQDKADSGRLSFQAMVVTTTITREVYGSAITTSNSKASGTVVFFNEYSTAKRIIKKGTTLIADTGKKYITQEAATVPGYTLSKDKKKTPGTSGSIKIVAADVGDSYNNTGVTLSVAGYSSKTFYARSTAIIGGESGVAHTLTDSEKADAITTLQAQLVERLKRETRAQIPQDYITFPDLQLPIIDTNTFSFQGGSVRFPASMTGTMVSYLIPRAKLEQAIAAKALRDKAYPTVVVPDIEALTFDMQTAIPTDPKVVPDAIDISVSGSGTVIAKVPVDTVRQRLAGKPRRTFAEQLKDIPEIDIAKFRLFPFWAPKFPTNWAKIDIITQ